MENQLSQLSAHQFVSVVVPVYNDSQRLKLCLESLENQSYPKSSYEVIVVDNASDQGENVKDVIEKFTQAIALYESQPGSYAARNKGISSAKGEIIAFTDSDCIPAADWIEKGVVTLLQNPDCGMIAGNIKFFFKENNQPTAVEFYDSLTSIPQKYFLLEEKFGATANLFTFKSVFQRVGCFDKTLKSGGDCEWGRRVLSFGYQQLYAEDVCVFHPARYQYQQIYKKAIRVAGAAYKSDSQRNRSLSSLLSILADWFKPPLKTTFRIISNQKVFPWAEQKPQGIMQKIKLIFIIHSVHYAAAFERMRLYSGGIPKRE